MKQVDLGFCQGEGWVMFFFLGGGGGSAKSCQHSYSQIQWNMMPIKHVDLENPIIYPFIEVLF